MLAEQIMAKRLPLAGGRPFMTFAMADEFTGQRPYGLREVLDATFQVAPEGVHAALVAAQEIDQDRKDKEAKKYIAAAATSAAAAAATPIPFSDATLLVPIQLGMMAKIAQLYKIKFDRAALMAVVSTTAATQVGRSAFTGLIKMVPGAGTVVGGAIGAGVATSFTYAMGRAWLTVCQRVAKSKLGRGRRGDRQRSAAGHVPRGVPQETEVRPQGTAGEFRRHRSGGRQVGPGPSSRTSVSISMGLLTSARAGQ